MIQDDADPLQDPQRPPGDRRLHRQDPAALGRVKDLVVGLNRCLLTLCIMVEHIEMSGSDRAKLSQAFGEAKATMWDLSDALHVTMRAAENAGVDKS